MISNAYLDHIKPIIDKVLVIIIVFLFAWLFISILLGYIITLQFPVFFKQDRIGKDCKVFKIIKFRTLVESEGENNKRKFFLGTLLRYFSLDELPQVWNVWKGDVSFIGPRPLPIEYLPLFSSTQLSRHLIKPGITGWAQINGRHAISWKEKFELDIYYIHHVTFFMDVFIVFKTIILLLSFKKDKSLVEEKFLGN